MFLADQKMLRLRSLLAVTRRRRDASASVGDVQNESTDSDSRGEPPGPVP